MKYLRNLIIIFISVIYFEFIFSIFTYHQISNVKNIVLLTLFVSIFITLLTSLFNRKVNNIIKYIILCFLAIYFSTQYVFHDVFSSYFSLSLFEISDQVSSFKEEAISAILSNFYVIILFFVPFIINLVFRKFLYSEKIDLKGLIIMLCSMVITFSIIFTSFIAHKNEANSMYELFFKINENSLNIEKLGVLTSGILDLERTIFGFDVEMKYEEIPSNDIPIIKEYGFNELELNLSDSSNSNIKKINEYITNTQPSRKNEYTGIFKGYNLIYITAESFSEIGVSEELTPTLYKLINSGFVFKNFYTPVNLSTIGGEFQSVTGLYANNSILSKWRSGTNSFPYGLGNVFKNIGYSTYAYHNNTYSFQDRNKYLKSIGFDYYKGCKNGMEKIMKCSGWPQSDDAMINATVGEYLNDEQFLTYYMTVSGHFPYSLSSNSMAIKHKAEVKNLKYNDNVKGYIATQIELDLALESLIKHLEDANILDKTVIVLQADHYPYDLSLSDINSVSTYKRDSVVEINHNALIIWNPNIEHQEIEKACMSIDVIPTVYNLFGIEYDSRLFIGNDIFSDKAGLAIFTNRSWVSDYGTYFANSSKFVPKVDDIPEDYVKTINEIVNTRLNMSKMIVANNYYSTLK